MDSGCVLKIKAVAFADNLDVHPRQRRVKVPSFGQSYWKDRVVIRQQGSPGREA